MTFRIAWVSAWLAVSCTGAQPWRHEVAVPPHGLEAPPDRGLDVVIQATRAPVMRGTLRGTSAAYPVAVQDGDRYRFLVPPGERIAEVSVGGLCSGCGGACPPANERGRWLTSQPTFVWRSEATKELESDFATEARYVIRVTAAGPPILTARFRAPGLSVEVSPPEKRDGGGFRAVAYLRKSGSGSVTWSIDAVSIGRCASSRACSAPAGSSPTIQVQRWERPYTTLP